MTPDEWDVFQRIQMQQVVTGSLNPYQDAQNALSQMQMQELQRQFLGQSNPLAGLGQSLLGSPFASVPQQPPPQIYTAPPLETGTKVEDLIGWRIWRLLNTGMLQSYSVGSIWLPGQPMTGEPGDHDSAGVWAFKDMTDAFRKVGENQVAGSVRLWGQVVEHERGYRAEFARIVSIDSVSLPGKYPWDRSQIRALKWLRQTYGVEA